MAKYRGNRPASPSGKLTEPVKPPDYNKETPKFCLRYLANGFDVHVLTTQQQAEFAKTLQKLTGFTWTELTMGRCHKHGYELLPVGQIKPSVPQRFQDQAKTMVFR
jgi:hypothetical protein